MEGLKDFLDGQQRNTWLTKNGQSVYVRKSMRYLGGPPAVQVIDIANIETPAKKQGKGRFKQFLIDLEQELQHRQYSGVYIENVLTEQFAEFFRRNGWTENNSGMPPCFYKKLEGVHGD